ncbi:MAG: XRE family transcriptional regulator [Eubacterium sp.]|nr:XRE family transcriptional regulator [Eubacterium sp.]
MKCRLNVMGKLSYSDFDEYDRKALEAAGGDVTDTFADYYRSRKNAKQRTNADLILNCDVEKSYFYQIMKGNRIPSRDKVLRLCIGAGFTIEETSYALILNENAPLYLKRRRDRVLAFAVAKGLSVTETNLLLDEQGEKTLQ